MGHCGILEPKDSKKADGGAEDTHLLSSVHVLQKEIDEDGVGDNDDLAVLGEGFKLVLRGQDAGEEVAV